MAIHAPPTSTVDPRPDLVRRQPIYLNDFYPRFFAGPNLDFRAGDICQFRKVFDEGGIGFAVDSGRFDFEPELIVGPRNDRILSGVRGDVDLQSG
jgi:hypothetical protein